MNAFGLHEPGLASLTCIVRGADTDRLDLAPQSAGLLALSLGLSRLHEDDHAMLAAALPLYDALYAWMGCTASAAAHSGSRAKCHCCGLLDVPLPWVVLGAGLAGFVGGRMVPAQFAGAGGHGEAAGRSARPRRGR